MSGTFGKALQALVFIDFYGQPQGGDLQPSQTAILIKKAIRQGELVTAQAGILRRRAVIIGSRWEVDCLPADGAPGRCAGLGNQSCPGPGQVGFWATEWRCKDSGILTAVDVAALRGPTTNDNHLVNRGGGSIHGAIRVVKLILRRQCRGRHHRRDGYQQHCCFQPVPHTFFAPSVS